MHGAKETERKGRRSATWLAPLMLAGASACVGREMPPCPVDTPQGGQGEDGGSPDSAGEAGSIGRGGVGSLANVGGAPLAGESGGPTTGGAETGGRVSGGADTRGTTAGGSTTGPGTAGNGGNLGNDGASAAGGAGGESGVGTDGLSASGAVSGQCPPAVCDDECVNLEANIQHCGACRRSCSTAGVDQPACEGGLCTYERRAGLPRPRAGCFLTAALDFFVRGGGSASAVARTSSQRRSWSSRSAAEIRMDGFAPGYAMPSS